MKLSKMSFWVVVGALVLALSLLFSCVTPAPEPELPELAYVRIEDAAGTEVKNFPMGIGQKMVFYARGYDAEGQLLGDISVEWGVVDPEIGEISPIEGTSMVFKATQLGVCSIVADTESYHDATGSIFIFAWAGFHHDDQNTGRSPYIGPSTPAVKWIYSTNATFGGYASITYETIYFASGEGYIYALNRDGAVLWRYAVMCGVCRPIDPDEEYPPAVKGHGTILYGADDGKFHAISTDNGTARWIYDIGAENPFTGSAAIGVDGTIYVRSYNRLSNESTLHAINPDGALKWKYNVGNFTYSVPALGLDGRIYIGSSSVLYAINPDGTLEWKYDTEGNIDSAPAIEFDGTIYIASGSALYAINPDGTLKWKYNIGGGEIHCSPAIGADGTIYIGSPDHKLYAICPYGNLRWAFPTEGPILRTSPAIGGDGTIYVGSDDLKLYAIDRNGNLKWAFPIGRTIMGSPVIGADGTIYIGSYQSDLYALSESSYAK